MSWVLSICTSLPRPGPSSVLGASRCRRSKLHRVLQPQRPLGTCAHRRRELLSVTEGSVKKGHGAAEDDHVAGRMLLDCARCEIAWHSQLVQGAALVGDGVDGAGHLDSVPGGVEATADGVDVEEDDGRSDRLGA